MIRKLILGLVKKLKFLPLDMYAKIYYEYYNGKKLNLENPKDFNEKIQWLKVYYHPPILSELVDKYTVRSYVEKKIGGDHLNNLIGVYNHPDEINYDELPNQFVIKGTHGCRYNLIVKDKKVLNKRKARRLMKKWLRRNYYYKSGLEWAYKNIKPRLIIEEYLSELAHESLRDYKFYCFNGKAKFVEVHLDRAENHKSSFYGLDSKKLAFRDVPEKKTIQQEIEMPENFEEMIEFSNSLAGSFPFVRVDLYSVNKKTVFGEMTFYPADARDRFVPEKYNEIIGSYVKLPDIPVGKKEITAYDPF